MQFLAIQIRTNHTIRQVYYRYGSYAHGYWNSALIGSDREHLYDFSSMSVNEAIIALAEHVDQIGTVLQINGLSEDTLYPCMLREYFVLPEVKRSVVECSEALSLAS